MLLTKKFDRTKQIVLLSWIFIVSVQIQLLANDSFLEFDEDDFPAEKETGLFNWSGDSWSATIKGNISNLTGIHQSNKASILNPDNELSVPKAENGSRLVVDIDASFREQSKFFMQNDVFVEYQKKEDETEEKSERKINQCHLTFEFGDETASFLTIGKQRIKWGVGAFWNPVDTVNSHKTLSELEKEKEGKTAYRLDIAWPSSSFTGIWVPNSDETDFRSENFSRQADHSLLAGRIYAYFWDSDISLYLSKKEKQNLKRGFSFSTVFGNSQIFAETIQWVGKSETVYPSKRSERTDGVDPVSTLPFTFPATYTFENKEGTVVKSLLGFQYTDQNDVTYIGEIYYNHQGYNQEEMEAYVEFLRYLEQDYQNDLESLAKVKAANAAFDLPGSYSRNDLLNAGNALYDFADLRQYYLHLFLGKSHVANRFDLGLDIVLNLDEYFEQGEASFFSRLSLAYTAAVNWLFTFYSQHYYGNDKSEFGMFYYENALFGEIKYYF